MNTDTRAGYKTGYQQALADVLKMIAEAQSTACIHGKGTYALHLQHIRAQVRARMNQVRRGARVNGLPLPNSCAPIFCAQRAQRAAVPKCRTVTTCRTDIAPRCLATAPARRDSRQGVTALSGVLGGPRVGTPLAVVEGMTTNNTSQPHQVEWAEKNVLRLALELADAVEDLARFRLNRRGRLTGMQRSDLNALNSDVSNARMNLRRCRVHLTAVSS